MDDDELPLIELLVFIPHARQRPDPEMRAGNQPQYDPSPAEIRQRCLEIQATWSEKVREARDCHGGNGSSLLKAPHPCDDR